MNKEEILELLRNDLSIELYIEDDSYLTVTLKLNNEIIGEDFVSVRNIVKSV